MLAVSPPSQDLLPVPLDSLAKSKLLAMEALTLAFLVALIFWSVGPLLEEWGMFRAFNGSGLAYFETFAPAIPMRPLHLVAYGLQWALGHGHPFGVAASTGLMLVLRYLVSRWAVSPLIQGYDRWVFSVVAATFAFWPGALLGRYGAAQLSALFFLVAFGFAVRAHRRWSVTSLIGCAVGVLLGLATYQGLTLCLLLIPVASLFWVDAKTSGVFGVRDRASRAIRVTVGIGLGFLLYFIYWLLIEKLVGNTGYEGSLAGDSARLLTLTGLMTHIKSAFITAYAKEAYLLPALLLIAFVLSQNGISRLKTVKARAVALSLIALAITFLPLLSVIYVNALHINDVDRVLFPVIGGFTVICFTILSSFSRSQSDSKIIGSTGVVAALLATLMVFAFNAHRYVVLQQSVIEQTWKAAESAGAKSVILRDETGTLGDVYTLYATTLTDAIGALGKNVSAIICTPIGVDRLHPVAQRFPIGSTERCESMQPAPPGSLVLYARWLNGALVVSQ